MAVGRVIKALPVVDRALEPTSLLCCSLRTPPPGSEHMGRRQPGLGVETGDVGRGCGSKKGHEGPGPAKADQLPLKVCVEGGQEGERRAGL